MLVDYFYYAKRFKNSVKNFAVNPFIKVSTKWPTYHYPKSFRGTAGYPPTRVNGATKAVSASYPLSLSSTGKSPKKVYIFAGKNEAARPKWSIPTFFCDWHAYARDQMQNVFTIAILR